MAARSGNNFYWLAIMDDEPGFAALGLYQRNHLFLWEFQFAACG
jgi:hypothetical protein